MSSYADKARDPETGRIRSYAEVSEAEHRAKTAARIAQIQADRETEAAKPELVKRIEMYRRQIADAKHNDDKARVKIYRDKLEVLEAELAAEQAQAKKAAAFAGDRRIALIREEADAIERSGHVLLPHASQLERDELVALARSNDWPDPQSQFAAFKEKSDRLTDVELEAERVKQWDAKIEAARQEVTLAESRVQQSELETMRAKREGAANE
jgi:hypothetical protein